MKNRMSFRPMTALAVIVLCSQIAPVLRAQNSNPAPGSAEAAAPASASVTPAIQLSPGVPEIVKLGRGHLSDEVIIAFIRNSGRTYRLSASELIYMREQGVSDQVLSAMLNAQPNVAATAAQAVPQPAPQLAPNGPTADWANSSPQPVPVATQPVPTYDATAPIYAQPSPVYTYPYPYSAPYYGYYGYGPYYWGYPALSFGFRFGGGGFHGGWHR